ncbi:hypothetical protein DOZ80_02570 [Pseudomonas fluorescens]|uniref:Uncharacterized protein n=1 Tax=Pseudomonas fluorescens TaxID=294 RepID=A0A327NDW2_PSEFL|nr:hypothetical protein DOZ80_02570 [Pseudomonas fluorescens]
MLAMDVNDNAGCQIPRGDLRFIASELAPTVKSNIYQTTKTIGHPREVRLENRNEPQCTGGGCEPVR